MQHLQPNTTLQGGKYKIERVLGQGGFGNTYVGVNTVFNETVAIKEFFMHGINDRNESTGSITISIEQNKQQFIEQLEKFKKEALRIRKLKNEHVVRVHDLFEDNGTAYYVMDFIDGESLAERLKRTGKPMTEEEVQNILPQLLDALNTVHNAGIWHLDLKPANIMLTKEGQVKLIDFGASKQLNAKKGGATTSTAISYTNGYAPREQMEQNYDKFGPWTDIYALGATIYTLLTNKRPPLPTNIDDDMSEDKHLALPLPDGISKDIKDLVLAMMHTNKNQRPQNVEAIMAILSDSNQKEKEVFDELSEETIIEPKRNGAKEEHNQDLIKNKKTQIDPLNKGIETKIETKKLIKTRLLLSLAIFFILGCIGWIIYHNSNEKKSLYQTLIVNNDSDQSSAFKHDVKGNQLKVFNALKNKGYTGFGNNEVEFGKLMNKSTNRRKVYDALVQEGYIGIGKDFNEFEKLIYQAQSKAEKPLQTLHRTLLKDNWDVPEDYSSFERTLTVKGEQGYRNRYNLWKALKDSNYDVPDSYESFSKTLFVPKTTIQNAQSSIYISNKLNDLFDDLRAHGFAKDKTREELFSYMLAPGKQGYQNRKVFFEEYKSHGLTNLNSYEEFADWLGLGVTDLVLTKSRSVQQSSKHTFRTRETATKPINPKIKQLYDAMKADGDDVGTEQEFNDYFLAKGDQGYKNRKAVWDYFKAAGADVGENYEEFAKWLGLRPVK